MRLNGCIGVRSGRLGAGIIFSTQLYLAAAGTTPAYARRADHFQLCAGLRIEITHRCSLMMGNQVDRAVFPAVRESDDCRQRPRAVGVLGSNVQRWGLGKRKS